MAIFFPEGKIPTLKWVAFHGDNGSLFDDDGISSVSRASTGRYVVSFDGNMSNNDYSCLMTGQYEYSCGPASETHNSYGTSSASMWHGRYGSGTSADGDCMMVLIVGAA